LGDPLVYVRAVHFAATIVAAGTVLFMVLVAEPAFRGAAGNSVALYAKLRRRWLAIVWAGLIIAVISAVAWLALLAANIYGAGIGEVWREGGLWTVVSQTRFGYVWSARLLLAALLAALLATLLAAYPMAPTTPATRSRWSVFAAILATGFLVAPAWIGHAGATPGEAGQIPLAADALHLLAAGTWLGGLPPLAMLLAAAWRQKEPSLAEIPRIAVQRFSLLGLASVGALLASGLVNSWYEVGSFGNLVTTTYGSLVLTKFGLFAAMIAVAAVNRFYLTPRLSLAGAVRRLQRNTMAEAALGFAAVLVVGFLGVMAPASHSHHHPAYGSIPADAAYVHIHSVSGMADVTIVPGHVGTARVVIRLWTEDFAPLAAQLVTLTLTPPPPGGGNLMRAAAKDQDGGWEIDDIELSQPGNWTVAVDARLEAKRQLVLEAPIVIEPKE
jgi:putative copper resistance protein D